MLKEVYVSPSVELVLLRADTQLASNDELDFDDFFTKPGDDPPIIGEPIESNPDIDIDLPL